jgi:hypothetical protein
MDLCPIADRQFVSSPNLEQEAGQVRFERAMVGKVIYNIVIINKNNNCALLSLQGWNTRLEWRSANSDVTAPGGHFA